MMPGLPDTSICVELFAPAIFLIGYHRQGFAKPYKVQTSNFVGVV